MASNLLVILAMAVPILGVAYWMDAVLAIKACAGFLGISMPVLAMAAADASSGTIRMVRHGLLVGRRATLTGTEPILEVDGRPCSDVRAVAISIMRDVGTAGETLRLLHSILIVTRRSVFQVITVSNAARATNLAQFLRHELGLPLAPIEVTRPRLYLRTAALSLLLLAGSIVVGVDGTVRAIANDDPERALTLMAAQVLWSALGFLALRPVAEGDLRRQARRLGAEA